MDQSRWRTRPHLRMILIAAASSTIPLVLTVPASASSASASSILQSVKSAIGAQHSAHVTFVGKASTSGTAEKIIADVGSATGEETLFEGKADLAIRVTPSYAYVSGDSTGLTTLFGMSSNAAKQLGTRWESWKAGSSQYSMLKGDVSLSSIRSLLPKSAGTTVSTRTSNGTRLYVLKWTTTASGSIPALSNTLTVSAQSPLLPVQATDTATGGTKITTTFSKWGETLHISTPPPSSTISSSHIKD